MSPSHAFHRGLLDYYEIEPHHLNPNRIQHMVAFIVLCEGYLGIEPHLDLWRHFFIITLQKKREKNRSDRPMQMGCTSIHLRHTKADEYMSIRLSTSSKGWHSSWFYIKNDAAAPCWSTQGAWSEAPNSWKWGVPDKDKRRTADHLNAIKILKANALRGSDTIRAYHARRVAPLMARTLPYSR